MQRGMLFVLMILGSNTVISSWTIAIKRLKYRLEGAQQQCNELYAESATAADDSDSLTTSPLMRANDLEEYKLKPSSNKNAIREQKSSASYEYHEEYGKERNFASDIKIKPAMKPIRPAYFPGMAPYTKQWNSFHEKINLLLKKGAPAKITRPRFCSRQHCAFTQQLSSDNIRFDSSSLWQLTQNERQEFRSWEYDGLRIFSTVVPLYGAICQLLGWLVLSLSVEHSLKDDVFAEVNPWWWSAFSSVSAYNGCGFSLLDDSMVRLRSSSLAFATMSLLALAGNLAYPICLRWLLWLSLQLLDLQSSKNAFMSYKSAVQYALKHPRYIYSYLFTARATWWLLIVLMIITFIDCLLLGLFNASDFLDKKGSIMALTAGIYFESFGNTTGPLTAWN